MHKTNTINDLIVSIKNGYSTNKKFVQCKINKLSLHLLWVLYKEGLISDFKINQITNTIFIKLKYFNNKPLINNIVLLSKPSLQLYLDYKKIQTFYNKYDYFFLSTSSGIISSRNISKTSKLGGQLLFAIKILS